MERDSLGVMDIDTDRYIGIQTLRAVENFSVSGRTLADMPELIRALALVKKAAARANQVASLMCPEKAAAIVKACDAVANGDLSDSFVVDVLQGGAGTSTNMNANEVIANRALELLGHDKGRYDVICPLGHVNRSQSTNDSYATAVRLSVYFLNQRLSRAINDLQIAFLNKAEEFRDVEKLGRTQLQDAVPMSAGSELHAYAVTLSEELKQLEHVAGHFLEVNMGGTAIGSGIGASAKYQEVIIDELRSVTELPIVRSANLFEASWDMGAFVLYSASIKRIAVKLSKIANDFRLLSSGPRGGLGEYRLPPRQPGSSLMPGKVNPVIPELVNIVCFRVIGTDSAITMAAEAGQLQLNAMEPLIVWSLSENVDLLARALKKFNTYCVQGLDVDRERCRQLLENSTALATSLVSVCGYEQTAEMARESLELGVSFREHVCARYPELLHHMKN